MDVWTCPVCGTTGDDDTSSCPRCGRDLDLKEDPPPKPGFGRGWQRRAFRLNAGSLLLILLVILITTSDLSIRAAQGYSAVISFAGALVNGIAGLLWIISSLRGPGIRVLWAGLGVVWSLFVGYVFMWQAVELAGW